MVCVDNVCTHSTDIYIPYYVTVRATTSAGYGQPSAKTAFTKEGGTML